MSLEDSHIYLPVAHPSVQRHELICCEKKKPIYALMAHPSVQNYEVICREKEKPYMPWWHTLCVQVHDNRRSVVSNQQQTNPSGILS